MAKLTKASSEVVHIAQELIEKYHPWLKDAAIGFVFQDPAPTSGGRSVLGKAQKVPTLMRVYLDFDFIIVLAENEYGELSVDRRAALVDHQLCHLVYDEGECSLRGHDVEEFHEIIQRHGYWTKDLIKLSDDDIAHQTHQLSLFGDAIRKAGKVEAVDIGVIRDGETIFEHRVETQPAEVA